MTDNEPVGTDAITAISRRFLLPGYLTGTPMTDAERARREEEKAAEYATKTSAGLVPIHTHGEGEYDDWQRSGPHDYFERWVSHESWQRYVAALAALKAAEADLG